MSKQDSHARPRWRVVAVEQVRAVGLAVRREAALASLVGIGLTAIFVSQYLRRASAVDLVPDAAAPMYLLAGLLPLAVWKAESLERRSYLWSLPVERGIHQLTKLGAGWVWLMIALSIYLLWGLALALATSGDIGMYTMAYLESGSIQRHLIEIPRWQWLVPFTTATIAYLFGSIPALASDYPIRWVAGAPIAFVFLGMLADETGFARTFMGHLFGTDAWYGFSIAMRGMVSEQGVTYRVPAVLRLWEPDLTAWLKATSLWMVAALVGVWIAGTRHREP